MIISLAAVAIGIERLTFYNYAANNGEKFLESLKDNLKSQNLNEVANFCHNEKNLLSEVAFAGIFSATQGENVELALETAYSNSAMKLNKPKISYWQILKRTCRMKHRDFREKNQPLVMIIPMIDIMLFLLVFFMLSTIYMVQTNNFQVNLPQSEMSSGENKPNPISITVTKSGEVMFDDSKILIKNLPPLVSHALSNDADAIFVIYGDRETQYEKVVAVLELLKKSGVRHVSIATELEGTGNS